MYRNASELKDGEILSGYDICIVGAGAAGIAMAIRLLDSAKKVIVIESGNSRDSGLNPPSVQQSLYKGTVGEFMKEVHLDYLTDMRSRMYGGTTNHFWYFARPLEEVDLKPRPPYRKAGWALDIAELNCYYPAANEFSGYGPFNYDDIEFWKKALHGEPFSSKTGDALENSIFHSQGRFYAFQTAYGGKLAPDDVKNVTVLFNANVLTVETDPSRGSVTRLHCATINNQHQRGINFTVVAGKYVLAQGGIEPVRLLKLSGNLGDNAQRHLGRGYMSHPVLYKAAFVKFSRPVDAAIRNFYTSSQVTISRSPTEGGDHKLVSGHIYDRRTVAGDYTFNAWGVLTPTLETLEREQIGNFNITLSFCNFSFAEVAIGWEQTPNEKSTVTLGDKLDPVFKQRTVNLDWNLVEDDKKTAVRGLELCREYLQARDSNLQFIYNTDLSGGPEHWSFNKGSESSACGEGKGTLGCGHELGTLRMSESPEDGIVDTDLKVHTLANLYIAGSGVFPTSGYANPTLTIVALALRLAEHLDKITD